MASFLYVTLSLLMLGAARGADTEVDTDGTSSMILTCAEACSDYSRWTYDCAQRAGCFSPAVSEEQFDACWAPCDAPTTLCHEMCLDNYEDILDTCDEKCEDKYLIDIYCEDRCFKREFLAKFQPMLPDLTSHDVGVWESLFGEDEEESAFDDK